MSEFVIRLHHAERAGTHQDLHLDGESWAVPKGVPTRINVRVLAIRTAYHSPEQARFIGRIEEGYGKGTSEVIDDGEYVMISESDNHRYFNLLGNEYRGGYYLRHWKGNYWLLWRKP